MVDAVVNVPYRFWIIDLQDLDGNPIVGATWDTSGCTNTDEAVITSPDNDSDYLVTITAAATGAWKFKAIPNDEPLLMQARTIQVGTDSAAALLAAPVAGYGAGTVGYSIEATFKRPIRAGDV